MIVGCGLLFRPDWQSRCVILVSEVMTSWTMGNQSGVPGRALRQGGSGALSPSVVSPKLPQALDCLGMPKEVPQQTNALFVNLDFMKNGEKDLSAKVVKHGDLQPRQVEGRRYFLVQSEQYSVPRLSITEEDVQGWHPFSPKGVSDKRGLPTRKHLNMARYSKYIHRPS